MNKLIACLLLSLSPLMVQAASWDGQGYTEDVSIAGTEKVFLENPAGTGNNWATLSTILAQLNILLDETLDNTFVGIDSGENNTTGHDNVSLGHSVLKTNTEGYSNSALGKGALYSNTTGYYNMAIGSDSLRANTTGHENTAVGTNALNANTTESRNVAIGSGALQMSVTSPSNTAVGYGALLSNTAANGLNVGIGTNSGYYNTSGYANTFLGPYTGYNSDDINNTDYRVITDNKMTIIGASAAKNSASALTNSTAIGYKAHVTKSNQVVIGNTDVTETQLNGAVYVDGVAMSDTYAEKTNIAFLAAAHTDLKILDSAQPVNGQAIVLDSMAYANADDALHVWSIDKVGSELAGKQATLVSGTNIKTINGVTVLGSGDMTIAGGATVFPTGIDIDGGDATGSFVGDIDGGSSI